MNENGIRYVTMPMFIGLGTIMIMLFGLAFSIVYASNATANEANDRSQSLNTKVGIIQNDVKWIRELMEKDPNNVLLLKTTNNGKNPN